jgi:hypothetical protein
VYLTKEESEIKACVAAPYCVSHGTIPPIEMSIQGSNIISSLCLPSAFVIGEATSVGEVSTALLSSNSVVHSGDQLSVVHLIQSISDAGVPRVTMKLHKFIIAPSDAIIFQMLVPQSLFYAINGRVGTDANAESGGIAYVLSRRVENKLHVSTQSIILTPGNTLYQEYSSDKKKKEAVESYGNSIWYVDPISGLNTLQDPEDTYFAITGVTLNGVPKPQGGGELDYVTGAVIVISGTGLTDVGLNARYLAGITGSEETVALSTLGSVVTTETAITLTATKNGIISRLLREDNEGIVYDFGN